MKPRANKTLEALDYFASSSFGVSRLEDMCHPQTCFWMFKPFFFLARVGSKPNARTEVWFRG